MRFECDLVMKAMGTLIDSESVSGGLFFLNLSESRDRILL
jgi:hypothetical protein